MNFSFEQHIAEHPLFSTPQPLDLLFGISQLDAASYQLPSVASSPTTPSGKQKKPRKRRSSGVGSDGKPYPTIKCTECPKTYRDNAAGQRHLQLHMTTHDPEAQAKFTCEKCGKNFTNEVFLKRHLNLCGVSRRRHSSLGSSTHDDSSNDSIVTAAVKNMDDKVQTIDEEKHTGGEGEVQLDFQAF